jgi:hypothetical protein
LAEVLVLVNDALTVDYAEFKRAAEALHLEVMKEVNALSIDWRPGA